VARKLLVRGGALSAVPRGAGGGAGVGVGTGVGPPLTVLFVAVRSVTCNSPVDIAWTPGISRTLFRISAITVGAAPSNVLHNEAAVTDAPGGGVMTAFATTEPFLVSTSTSLVVISSPLASATTSFVPAVNSSIRAPSATSPS